MKATRRTFKTPAPKASSPNEYGSIFSTDIALKRRDINGWIQANAFQKTHADIQSLNADGTAMDSAVAMDSDSITNGIKAAFTINQGIIPQSVFAWYIQQGFIGYQACAIIAQNWLVDKACRTMPEDALKKGFKLTANEGDEVDMEVLKKLQSFDNEYKIKENLLELEKFNRVFGIRIALFHVESNDPDYYLKPFNIDGVSPGSYKGISQVDPYWITPELDGEATAEPNTIDFYEPTWWRISGRRYHKSHLHIIRYTEVPDVLKPSYIYGGIPLSQLLYERVYAAERTANEGPMLAMTKRTNVVKTNTAKALANQGKFEERMAVFNEFRDNHGIFVIDKEEEYNQTDTALSDLDATIMNQYQLVAAIAETPATRLIETPPKGFNATGEFEQVAYEDKQQAIQSNHWTPFLDRHYELLIKSEIAPSEGIEPFNVTVVWEPLRTATPKEQAELNESKSRSDAQWQNTGAIDAEEIRDRLIGDPDSGFDGLDADLLPYETGAPEGQAGGILPNLHEQEKTSILGGASGVELSEEESIQDVALNGAQVTSMIEVITQVAQGQLPRGTGLSIIKAAFPISPEDAENMMGEVGKSFVPKTEESSSV